MKRLHASAGPTKKHHCSRCKLHKSKVTEFRKLSGRKYNLCDGCRKAVGK